MNIEVQGMFLTRDKKLMVHLNVPFNSTIIPITEARELARLLTECCDRLEYEYINPGIRNQEYTPKVQNG
jgi:hypothetical protein